MAKLSTTLAIQDAFTSKLQTINNSLRRAGEAMTQFRRTAEQPINPPTMPPIKINMGALKEDLDVINQRLKLNPSNAELAAKKMQLLGTATEEAAKKVDKLKSQQAALGAAKVGTEEWTTLQRAINRAELELEEFKGEMNTPSNNAAVKSAESGMNSLASTFSSKGEFIKGIFQGIGQKIVSVFSSAFSTIKSGISGMVSELSSASATWQTFQGNMEMIGMSGGEITKVKGELQDFATQTIYSASDMASTYGQLAAVGTKNTLQLVKGFGGLASAAENPAQAMKTLSQQATQMAAKPKIAWEDYKLVQEQLPGSMAMVAKQMGMSLGDLQKKIQDQTMSTEEFFDAVTAVGNSDSMIKMATSFKTVGQAVDGFKEGLTGKLMPAWEKIQTYGIKAVEKLSNFVDGINFDGLTAWIDGFLPKLESGIGKAIDWLKGAFDTAKAAVDQFMWGFDSTVPETALGTLQTAFDAVKGAIEHVSSALGIGGGNIETFADIGAMVGDVFREACGKIEEFANWVSKLKPETIQKIGEALKIVAGAIIGMKVGGAVFGAISKGIGALKTIGSVVGGIKDLALKLAAVVTGNVGVAGSSAAAAGGTAAVGTASGAAAPSVLQLGGAILMIGGGILLAAAGMWLLVNAAMTLASGGMAAVGALLLMVAIIGGLIAVVIIFGGALAAGAVGLIMFGVGLLLIGIAVFIAAAGLALLATQLPLIAAYGLQAALGLVAIGGAMIIIGIGAIVVSVGLILLGVGLVVVGVAALVAAIGVMMLGAGLIMVGFGVMLAAVGMLLLGVGLSLVASVAMTAATGLMMMMIPVMILAPLSLVLGAGLMLVGAGGLVAAVGIVAFGVGALAASVGVLVLMAAVKAVASSVKTIASNATKAAASLMEMVGSVNVVTAGLDAIKSKAKSAVDGLINAFKGGKGNAQSAGQELGQATSQGVATGIMTGTPLAMAAMSSLMNSVRAIGMAGASSFVSIGVMIGQGLAAGLRSAYGAVAAAASALVEKASEAARAKAQIHSPSRLFAENGDYMGQGLIVGLKNQLANVATAGAKLSESAYNGSNDVPSRSLGTQAVNNTNNSTSDQRSFNFNGDIVIQSTGDTEVDVDKILERLDEKLMETRYGGLAY